MNSRKIYAREEFERIRRVSDMLCSGHAHLHDKYLRFAFLLDISIFALSTWIVALSFVDPKFAPLVTPFKMDAQLWTGTLGIIAFFLSILQLRVDWKGMADCHKRSFDVYSEVKRLTSNLLGSEGELDITQCADIISRYQMATIVGASISEREFLIQKQRHQLKKAISKILDSRPSSSIALLRLKLWFRDNFKD